MKFLGFAGYRRDNKHCYSAELTDDAAPTLPHSIRDGETYVRIDTKTVLEIEVPERANAPFETYRLLVHDLTKVIAALSSAGFTTEQILAQERDVPNVKLFR